MKFFVTCPLGFESELKKEIESFWLELMDLDGNPTTSICPELEMEMGGLEFQSEMHLALQICFFSKLASRVLVRIANFEARYFDQFEKGLKNSKILDWLEPCDLKLQIDFFKSRLNNEKNLIEAATHVLTDFKFKVRSDAKLNLFVRIAKDKVTVSLDLAGEHLHKRGYATFRGEAPLRENLAAFVVRKLKLFTEDLNSKDLTVLDPFAGSGTLLFEWISQRTPLFQRDFAGLHLKKTPKIFKSDSWKKNYRWIKPVRESLKVIGFEKDLKTLQAAQQNEAIFNKFYHLNSSGIEWKNMDSIRMNELDWSNDRIVWGLTNPPYGERLSDEAVKPVLAAFDQLDKARGLIVLEPLHWQIKFKNLKLVHQEPFVNQGLKLHLKVYKK